MTPARPRGALATLAAIEAELGQACRLARQSRLLACDLRRRSEAAVDIVRQVEAMSERQGGWRALVLPMSFRGRAAGSTPNREKTAVSEADRILRESVLAELEFEPSVDARHIGVAVKDGIVTLTGHIVSFAEKFAAERAVRRVRGVRAIVQEIEVQLPRHQTADDGAIAARVAQALEWNVSVPHDRITIKVEDGVVTLRGEVDWHFQKEEALASIRTLAGVRSVIDYIAIKPSVMPTELKQKIEQAFRRSAVLDADAVSVSVEDGRVTLTGRVHSDHERAIAEQVAWSAPGVTAVVDRLQLVAKD